MYESLAEAAKGFLIATANFISEWLALKAGLLFSGPVQ